MTAAELRESRALIMALHQQADITPRLRSRLAAYRTALACIEAVQAATDPAPAGRLRAERSKRQAVPQTVHGDYRPTLYTPEYARTEVMS